LNYLRKKAKKNNEMRN